MTTVLIIGAAALVVVLVMWMVFTRRHPQEAGRKIAEASSDPSGDFQPGDRPAGPDAEDQDPGDRPPPHHHIG